MKKDRADDVLISARELAQSVRRILGTAEAGQAETASVEHPEDVALRSKIGQGLEETLALLDAEPDRNGVLFAPDHEAASLLQSFLAENAAGQLDELRRGGKLDALPEGGYEAKFDSGDATGWALSLLTWWRRALQKHAFIGPPEEPDRRLPNHARIAVLGDWGSGRYGAPVSAATIQAAKPAFDMLLHLGDVYYSGTEKEVRERFLDFWPDVPGALSRAINSNHEMYSGGAGFFNLTLKEFTQSSSCFAAENDNFLLVGLDTGYDEHDLGQNQVPWLVRLVERAKKNAQKVVLFTHHQPFSALEKQGVKLVGRLRPLLEAKSIWAWYWGHEHRAAIYDRHVAWGLYGRLCGNSGFPYFRDQLGDRPLIKTNSDGSEWRRVSTPNVPDAMVLDGPNPYVTDDPNRYGPNGHMSLELDGPRIIETVLSPNGHVLFQQTIE